MGSVRNIIQRWGLSAIAGGLVCMTATGALAAVSEGSSWRPLYDQIMMYINFLILVGVLFKFLKKPIQDFLAGKKESIQKEINRMEEQKRGAAEKIKEAQTMLAESNARLDRIRERILNEGERNKQEIIDSARDQSRIMLEGAKRKIESQILQARQAIRAELVDSAVDLAFERLPTVVTAEDNQRFVDLYLKSAS